MGFLGVAGVGVKTQGKIRAHEKRQEILLLSGRGKPVRRYHMLQKS